MYKFSMYKNEAELMIYNINDELKKEYKHLKFNFTIQDINGYVESIIIRICENRLHIQRNFEVENKGFFSSLDYKDYILISIRDNINQMLKNYYTT